MILPINTNTASLQTLSNPSIRSSTPSISPPQPSLALSVGGGAAASYLRTASLSLNNLLALQAGSDPETGAATGNNLLLQQKVLTEKEIRYKELREAFAAEFSSKPAGGIDKLAVPGPKEDANLVSLQTKQQLSIQSLAFAGQSQAGLLSLLR